MSEQDVVALMKSSTSAAEWQQNTDKVWHAYGEYPHFWYAAIIQSGVEEQTKAHWTQECSAHE